MWHTSQYLEKNMAESSIWQNATEIQIGGRGKIESKWTIENSHKGMNMKTELQAEINEILSG